MCLLKTQLICVEERFNGNDARSVNMDGNGCHLNCLAPLFFELAANE